MNVYGCSSLCLIIWNYQSFCVYEYRKRLAKLSSTPCYLLETSIVSYKIQSLDASGLGDQWGQVAYTGLVVGSDNAPGFNRDDDEAYANDYWDDNKWNDNSVVAFRDCSR